MSTTRFSVNDHKLQLFCDLSGKESVIYDDETVSEKQNFGLSSTHHFEVIENGENVEYNVTFKPAFSGLVQYNVKCNNILIKKGSITPMTIGVTRIFFFFLGFGLVGQLLVFAFPQDIRMKVFTSGYTPSELNWLYINLGIDVVFGIFFLLFAFLLKQILLNRPKLITTTLWVRIAIMSALSPLLLWNSIQRQNFLDFRFGIVPWIGYIWLFWFLLENSKAIAKDLKSKI
jgi:hypothetical protein